MLSSKLSLIIVLCSVLSTAEVHASGFAVDSMIPAATLPEQLVQQLTMIEQYTTQASQLQQQIQMQENQVRNMTGLPIQMWSSVSGDLNDLVNLVGNAQGLNYASQDTLGQISQQYGNGQSILPGLDQQLQKWTGNFNGQIAAVLNSFGLQARSAQTAQQALAAIEAAGASATGRKQALDAANQIAGLTVNQLQALQQTIMAGKQAELNYMGNKANQEQQDRNNAINFIQPAQIKF